MFPNLIKNNINFNVEAKLHFIEVVDVKDTTKLSFIRILKKIAEVEKFFEKNIYDFTYNDYTMLLRTFNAASTDSIYAYHCCVKKYIEFCKTYNYTNNLLGYLDTLTQDELRKYVSKKVNDKMYLTSVSEFNMLIEGLPNMMDICAITLIFYGLKGKDLIEVRQLEKTDVDFENQGVYVFRNFKKEFLQMPIEVMEIIRKTLQDEEYVKVTKTNKVWFRKLIDSNYLIRNIRDSNMIKKPSLTRRIYMLKQNDWGNEYISAGTIHRSGCALYAIDLMKNQNFILDQAINKALKRYGLSQSLYYKVKEVVEYIEPDRKN